METKRIVIVEDDRAFCRVMEQALRKQGYEVVAADSGTDGEAKIRELLPDLAILDVMTPGKNGLDLCQDLKKSEEYRDIPILMMTCMTEESEKDDNYWREQTGADDFITKPFPMGELVRRVRSILAPPPAPCS